MTEVNFYDKEQVDDLLEDKADVSSVGTESDAASESGTLWARIKYVLTHWMTKDSEQTVTAKKTFTVSPEVPVTPATDDSAVNSFYVNDSTGTVENNLVHKDGIESISGEKFFGTTHKALGYVRQSSSSGYTTPVWMRAIKTKAPLLTANRIGFILYYDDSGYDSPTTSNRYLMSRVYATYNGVFQSNNIIVGSTMPADNATDSVLAVVLESDRTLSVWYKQTKSTQSISHVEIISIPSIGIEFEGKIDLNLPSTEVSTSLPNDAISILYLGS